MTDLVIVDSRRRQRSGWSQRLARSASGNLRAQTNFMNGYNGFCPSRLGKNLWLDDLVTISAGRRCGGCQNGAQGGLNAV